MGEAILMAVIGPLVALLGLAINVNAGLSPGDEGGRMVGGFLFLLGLLWFAIAALELLKGGVAG
jgi:hypothetical protein